MENSVWRFPPEMIIEILISWLPFVLGIFIILRTNLIMHLFCFVLHLQILERTPCSALMENSVCRSKYDQQETIFPPEIITEILSWLPVKVVVRLQLVCKQWYATIQDRHFIESYMRRGFPIAFVVNIIPYRPSSLSTSDQSFKLLCGCDGLLLQKCNITHKYHIKNPATHQVLELPDPRKTKLPVTFNFVRSTSEYKLVSTYDGETDCEGAFCEVLTVGTDNLWKPLKIPSLSDVYEKRENVTVVSTGSAVHWYQIYKVGSSLSREVVSLDLGNECFTITTLPNNLYRSWERVWALNWSGKLAFADIVKEELQVLVLEDYKKQKWSEKKTVVPLTFINKNGYWEDDLVPVSVESGTVWFWLKDKIVFSYNMETGCIGQILQSSDGKIMEFFVVRPSLVSFKGMKPEKEEFLKQQEKQV